MTMVNAWLDEHQDRAEKFIYIFYVLAALSAIAIVVPLRWPKSSVPLAIVVVLLGAALGLRLLHRLCGRKSPAPRISQRTAPPIKSEHQD
jgi:uncharacterized membrane protein YoaK (UPF0700 family)